MALYDDILSGLTPQNGREFDDLNQMLERLRAVKVADTGEDYTPGFGMAVQNMPPETPKKPIPQAEAPSTASWRPSMESNAPLEQATPQKMSIPQTAPITRTQQPAAAPASPAGSVPKAMAISAPQPDFFDRLGALARGYNTGGLIGGLSDAFGSGLDRQTEAMTMTGKALVEAGVSPSVVNAALRQPELMKQLIATRFGAKTQPTYGVIGENAMGQKQYGWIDPTNQRVTPAQLGAQGVDQPPQIDASVSGEEFLKQLPPGVATQVKALTEGRLRPPPMGRKNPYWEQLLQYAGQYEPGFDMTKFAARQATRTDFDKGKAAANIKSLNTVMGHLDSLDKTVDELGNYGWMPSVLNPVNQYVRGEVLGDPEMQKSLAKFELNKEAVASELMKVFRETGGSVTEIQGWAEKIRESASAPALHASIKAALELIGSRMNAVNDQWNRAMNVDRDPREILSPTAREIYDRLYEGGKKRSDIGKTPAEKPAINLRGVPDQPPPGAQTDANGKVTISNPNFNPNLPESASNPRRLKWVP